MTKTRRKTTRLGSLQNACARTLSRTAAIKLGPYLKGVAAARSRRGMIACLETGPPSPENGVLTMVERQPVQSRVTPFFLARSPLELSRRLETLLDNRLAAKMMSAAV